MTVKSARGQLRRWGHAAGDLVVKDLPSNNLGAMEKVLHVLEKPAWTGDGENMILGGGCI